MIGEQEPTHPALKSNPARGTCAFIGACGKNGENCQLGSSFYAAIKLKDSDAAIMTLINNDMFSRCPKMNNFADQIKRVKGRLRLG